MRGFVVVVIGQAIFMHNPISLHSFRRFPSVEDQSLLDTNLVVPGSQYRLIGPSSLPVARSGGPVWSGPVRVLTVPWAEEVPFLFSKHRLFREFPGVKLVEIEFGDDGDGERGGLGLGDEVVDHQLLVGRVEPEPRRQLRLLLLLLTALHLSLSLSPPNNIIVQRNSLEFSIESEESEQKCKAAMRMLA